MVFGSRNRSGIRRRIAAAFVLAASASAVHRPSEAAGDAHALTVRIVGPAETVIAVVDPEAPRVVARANGPTAAFEAVDPGCEVWAGAPGHDLLRLPVGGQSSIDATLAPASATAVLHLAPSAGLSNASGADSMAETAPSVNLRVHYLLGGEGIPPLPLGQAFGFDASFAVVDGLAVPVPKGYRAEGMILSGDLMVSPAFLALAAGGETTIAVERPRTCLLRGLPSPLRRRDVQVDLALLAYDTVPETSPALREAILWWATRPTWARVRASPDGIEIRGLPPADVNAFLRIREQPCSIRIPAGAKEIALAEPTPRRVTKVPTIDGQPAPSGTRVLAGRLDLLAVAEVLRRDPRERYWADTAKISDESPIALAWSPSVAVTLATPDMRIAYGTWQEKEPLAATSAPGAITFESPTPVDLSLDLYPTWPLAHLEGSTDNPYLTFSAKGSASLTIGGLPLGYYRGRVRVGTVERGALLSGDEFQARVSEQQPATKVRLKKQR